MRVCGLLSLLRPRPRRRGSRTRRRSRPSRRPRRRRAAAQVPTIEPPPDLAALGGQAHHARGRGPRGQRLGRRRGPRRHDREGRGAAHPGARAARARRAARVGPLRARPRVGDRRERRRPASSFASCRASSSSGCRSTCTARASTTTSSCATAGLAEGGEIVAPDIDEAADARRPRTCALHGYPAAHVEVQTRATDDPGRTLVLVDVHARRAARSSTSATSTSSTRSATRCMPLTRAYAVRPGRPRRPGRARHGGQRPRAGAARGRLVPRRTCRTTWCGSARRVTASASSCACASTPGRCRCRGSRATTTTTRGALTERARPRHRDRSLAVAPGRQAARLLREARLPRRRGPPRGARRRAAIRCRSLVFHVDEHPRVARRVAPLSLPQARRHPAPVERRPALVGGDRHGDRQLPRRGAPRRGAARRPEPDGSERDLRRGRRADRHRRAPQPARPRSRPRRTWPTRTTARPSTCRSSIATRASSTRRSAPCRSCARSAIPRSPAGEMHRAAPAAARHRLHLRRLRAFPLPTQPLDPAVHVPPRSRPRRRVRARDAARHPGEARAAHAALGRRLHRREARQREGGGRRRAGSRRRLREHLEARRRAPPHRRLVQGARLRVRRRQVHARAFARQHARARPLRRDRGRPGHRQLESSCAASRARARASSAGASRSPRASPTARATYARRRSAWRRSASSRASRSSLADPYVPAPTQGRHHRRRRGARRSTSRSGPGFSTGEGVRGTLEYGHRNLFGYAWSVTFHVQASLPAGLPHPRSAGPPELRAAQHRRSHRHAQHGHLRLAGDGPRADCALAARRRLRARPRADFTLNKASALGTIIWRPVKQVQLSGGPDYENNNVRLFGVATIQDYLNQQPRQHRSRSACCACPTERATSSPSAACSPGIAATARSTRTRGRTSPPASSRRTSTRSPALPTPSQPVREPHPASDADARRLRADHAEGRVRGRAAPR